MMIKFVVCSALGVGLVGEVIHLYVRGKKEKPVENEQSLEINEVLFFPDKEFPCKAVTTGLSSLPSDLRICHSPSCRRLHGRESEAPSSMIKFLKYLAGAARSVDLCIYVFTQNLMAEILRDLHAKGIKVRIITDGSEDEADGSQTERLRDVGIQIKSNKRGTGALMHHKFVIIDGSKLLSGSFNWTNKAVVSNYEAVLVTSNPSFVEPFKAKFHEMWSEFGVHTKSKAITQRQIYSRYRSP